MVEESEDVLWELENLGTADGLCSWMFSQFEAFAHGTVVEIGPGIGTFTKRVLESPSVDRVLLIEPDERCATILKREFSAEKRVAAYCEQLPDSRALRDLGPDADFVLCQNVLEHIEDEQAAVDAMARALRPGGSLGLLVPGHKALYTRMDERFGHFRRYSRDHVEALLSDAGLRVDDVYSFNALGIAGWWVQGFRAEPEISQLSLRAYEALLKAWRPIEDRVTLPFGLSVVGIASRVD